MAAAYDDRLTRRLLVIGADAAGMSAASQARRRREPEDLQIVAFDRGSYSSYSACGIPYLVSGVVGDVESLVVRSPQTFRTTLAIQVHRRHEVLVVDLDRGVALVNHSESGHQREEGFDDLMLATGAVPVRPSLPGAGAGVVNGCQSLGDGVAMRAFV
jgi:NADPH-dependent 2,4-dienoyl-CoA reductase/sulfur reductase-like enzyme